MKSTILDVSALSVFFENKQGSPFQAVKDLSFSLQRGEILGIAGESGSGKSVSALALLRLLPESSARVQSTRISFFDKAGNQTLLHELNSNQFARLRGEHLSMIFQEPGAALNPVMRCGDQIAEMFITHRKHTRQSAKSESLKLIAEVLPDNPERIYAAYPHQLSGGQKQRVMIAVAMACKPEVLIADEPTTALDVSTQKNILTLMKRLRDDYGTAILFISHDLNLLSGFADNVLIMQQGLHVESGPVDQVFMHPKEAYTRGLISCRPPLDKRFFRLPTLQDYLSKEPASSIFNPLHPTNIITQAERAQIHREIYSKQPLLTVKDLSIGYKQRRNVFSAGFDEILAVNHVSLQLYPGETLGLVGESGSGKSSLGRAILRLEEPLSGEIHFDGQNITAMNQSQFRLLRKRMQMVFQDPFQSLNPDMTVEQMLSEPIRVHGLMNDEYSIQKRVQTLLERVHLPKNFRRRYPKEMSGGQRQRLCIARALALQPDFLVFDEAVSALDVSVQAQIINLINELKREMGFSCLFISHDIGVVRFVSDRIAVLKKGEIVEQGEADQLCSQPAHEYTRSLLDAVPKGNLFT